MKKLIQFIERLLDKIIKIQLQHILQGLRFRLKLWAVRQSNEFNSTQALAASALSSC